MTRAKGGFFVHAAITLTMKLKVQLALHLKKSNEKHYLEFIEAIANTSVEIV